MIEEEFTECNANIISIKASFAIDMGEFKDDKKTDFQAYQQVINKLMYVVYNTRSDIVFGIGQLIKYNAYLRKSHPQAAKLVV